MGGVINPGFLQNKNFLNNYSTPYLVRSAGMQSIPYTLPLTEVGTVKIITRNTPDFVDKSLASLANPKEEKRFRKQTFVEIEKERFGFNIDLPNKVEKPLQPHYKWGDFLQVDHLSLYTMKYRDYETASLTVSNIPEEAFELSKKLSLNFFDRYYTDGLKYIPKNYLKNYIEVLTQFDILPYDSNDFQEFNEVKKFLSTWYEFK